MTEVLFFKSLLKTLEKFHLKVLLLFLLQPSKLEPFMQGLAMTKLMDFLRKVGLEKFAEQANFNPKLERIASASRRGISNSICLASMYIPTRARQSVPVAWHFLHSSTQQFRERQKRSWTMKQSMIIIHEKMSQKETKVTQSIWLGDCISIVAL